jgi:phage gp46-like protein
MDILMLERGDGGDLEFAGGDIAYDNGFYTAIYISLFSGSCFASIFSDEMNTDSMFMQSLNQTITLDSLREMEKQATLALDWLKKDDVVADVTVEATSPKYNRVNFYIKITEKSGKQNQYAAIWDAEKQLVARFYDVNKFVREPYVADIGILATEDGIALTTEDGYYLAMT